MEVPPFPFPEESSASGKWLFMFLIHFIVKTVVETGSNNESVGFQKQNPRNVSLSHTQHILLIHCCLCCKHYCDMLKWTRQVVCTEHQSKVTWNACTPNRCNLILSFLPCMQFKNVAWMSLLLYHRLFVHRLSVIFRDFFSLFNFSFYFMPSCAFTAFTAFY